jgi:hypothetical protein
MKKHLYLFGWLFTLLTSFSVSGFTQSSQKDSVQSTKDSIQSKKQKNYSTTAIVRMHSMGIFSFSGRLISDNPTADLFLNYNYSNKWGVTMFKAADLYQSTSDYNFLLVMANKNFTLNKKLNVNVFGGFLLEQEHHFADHGSDIIGNITTTYKVSKYFTIEHMGLFGNLVFERSNADWVNRFKFIFSKNHVDLTAWAWFNNKVFDTASYTSTGISAFYNRIPISSRLALGTGITGLLMLQSSDTIANPKKNGVLLTVTATWH